MKTIETAFGGSGPTGALVVVKRSDGPVYEAKWRRGGRQIKRRVGPAWLDATRDGGWVSRRGRVPEGHFDEKRATVRMAELIAEHETQERAIEAGERERHEHGVSFRELAAQWLEYLERERGCKPSTLRDYRYMLAQPGTAHRRGKGKNPGLIMAALGDRPIGRVTTREISTFLRQLDGTGISPRTVNKYRQVLSAIFNYARRADTHGLQANPVEGTTKRREPPPAVIDFYEPEEIEQLARAATEGLHRRPQPPSLVTGEVEWRAREDAQDAELFRLAGYTGLRFGELLALRWSDIDLDNRRMIVHRAISAEVEGPTKSWQARFIPLADPAVGALVRLRARNDYTSRDDYVFCSRLGGRLDASAVRRRFKRARDAAGLRALRFHTLRHAAGSLVARHADARFVQDFLGHSRITTTERYMHAKARPEDVERVNLAFAPKPSPSPRVSVSSAQTGA
ncbi:MAG TPA: tyrosine-type recombinase/integrase [Solirubrobacteraceae bacterium]|jgi:integrase